LLFVICSNLSPISHSFRDTTYRLATIARINLQGHLTSMIIIACEISYAISY